jgi:hypothetical protein
MAPMTSWAARSTPIWVRYSNACQRVKRLRHGCRLGPLRPPPEPAGLVGGEMTNQPADGLGNRIVSASSVTMISLLAWLRPAFSAPALPVFCCSMR